MSDTWCVYQPDWVEVRRTSVPGGRDLLAAVFRSDWKGKVGDDDWRLAGFGKRDQPSWILELKLPCLKGEFKDKELAEQHAGTLGEGAVVVPWGSEEEEELLAYGTRQPSTA